MFLKDDSNHYFNLDLSLSFGARDSNSGSEFYIDFYNAGSAIFATQERRDKMIETIENHIAIIALDKDGTPIQNFADDDDIDHAPFN